RRPAPSSWPAPSRRSRWRCWSRLPSPDRTALADLDDQIALAALTLHAQQDLRVGAARPAHRLLDVLEALDRGPVDLADHVTLGEPRLVGRRVRPHVRHDDALVPLLELDAQPVDGAARAALTRHARLPGIRHVAHGHLHRPHGAVTDDR